LETELLNIPRKLNPLLTEFDKYRYFLLEGGRGGGKSQTVGRFISTLAEKYNLRVVCGREIQNSISESVYSLLSDLIKSYKLAFDVQSSKIIHKKSGSIINFRGFREQGAFNIQGMEGIDILWIDEAQAITKQTLDVLIPTIRKETAKIIFTMNRHVVDDPVYETFAERDDCMHIHINYEDNPFCTEALKKEANECLKKSQADYDHIWLGKPLARSEDCVFGYDELKATQVNKYSLQPNYGYRIAGYDIARYGDDKCAAVILQQMGALHWETFFIDEWDHKDLNYTTGRILMTSNQYECGKSIIDEDGIGAGPLDTLQKGRQLENFIGFKNPTIAYKDNQFYANKRTENTYKLKEMITKGYIAITDDELIKELCTLRYAFDHQQRRVLISKDKMRKEGYKSPNKADALIMAVSMIGNIKYKQELPFMNRPKQYNEGNLFDIAGVR